MTSDLGQLRLNYTHVIWVRMADAGFGSKVVLDVTGITYRQLDY